MWASARAQGFGVNRNPLPAEIAPAVLKECSTPSVPVAFSIPIVALDPKSCAEVPVIEQ